MPAVPRIGPEPGVLRINCDFHGSVVNRIDLCLFLQSRKRYDNHFLVKKYVIKILPQLSLSSRDRFYLPQQTDRHSGF
jgi:hypothetical protein